MEDERKILAVEEDKKREKVTLLKAAHHGSNGSSSEEFLECFSPAFTVLSYGEGNTYGHPAPEAVERLEQTGTEIWRTADSGQAELKLYLQRKGISREIIREQLEETEHDSGEAIRVLLEKKHYRAGETAPEEEKKIIAYLMRRGFSWEDIRREMKEQEDALS